MHGFVSESSLGDSCGGYAKSNHERRLPSADTCLRYRETQGDLDCLSETCSPNGEVLYEPFSQDPCRAVVFSPIWLRLLDPAQATSLRGWPVDAASFELGF